MSQHMSNLSCADGGGHCFCRQSTAVGVMLCCRCNTGRSINHRAGTSVTVAPSVTPLQQVIDKFRQGDIETFAQRCYEAGQASQRERDAQIADELEALLAGIEPAFWALPKGEARTEWRGYMERFKKQIKAIRSSSLTEQA